MQLQAVRSAALRLFALIALVALTACGSTNQDTLVAAGTAAGPDSPLAGQALPAFPVDRGTSLSTPLVQTGSQCSAKSASASVNGTDLLIPGTTNQLQYGMFTIGTSGDATLSVTIDMLNSVGKYYLGLADYTSQHWVISGPFSGDRLISLTSGNYTSPANNFNCFVATFGGSNVTLQSVTLNVDHAAGAFSISGNITSGGAPLSGVTVNISGAATSSTSTDGSGNYSFAGLGNGNYTLTPTKANFTFTPTTLDKTINNGNVTGANFSGTQGGGGGHTISGHVTDNNAIGLNDVLVTLSGPPNQQVHTAIDGSYSFSGVPDGGWTVTPSYPNYTFNPPLNSVTVAGADKNNIDFTGTNGGGGGHSISGTVTDGAGDPVAGLNLSLSPSSNAAMSDSVGHYQFNSVADGTYTITPEVTGGRAYAPASIPNVTVAGADVTGKDFLRIPHYETADGEILALINLRCSACHTTQQPPSGNIHMTPYNSAKNNATIANAEIQADIMPEAPQPKLTAKQKAMFKAWVDNGKLQ